MSQNTKILEYLKQGKSITSLTALNLFGCFRLSARINDLKGLGYNISSKSYKVPRSNKTVAIYKLIKEYKEDISSDYDRDEDGNLISCCGDILDEDIMICPTCKEHN